ncbi:hypothetical protein ACQUQU_03875 [Thalassolituus sp. LLYu03]|uniref:hypothetical protein n=1 Tax=Thalassolituus sp. LLYu03 TaxID=3421656 RepID=UPI003D292C01
MNRSRIALALLMATPLAQAEFSNTSYSFFSAGVESVSYGEHLDNFGGNKVDSEFTALNFVQRSGGYTAIDDRFGFFIKTASTLIANEETEEWKAKGFSGPVQEDVAAMNFQMLDLNMAYHMGNGGYWLAGIHYQKIAFSRFGWASTSQTDAFADSIEEYIKATPSLYSQIQTGITNGSFVDSAGNTITTEEEYFAATRYDPEDTLDVVFEDASSFSLTGGFEYDSYFVNQTLGLRYMGGATVGLNLYENVLNSSSERSLTRSFGGGVDLHLVGGIGYQFRPEVGALLMLEANGSWRDGIKEKLSSTQTVELPDNTFYAYALTGSVFWNF